MAKWLRTLVLLGICAISTVAVVAQSTSGSSEHWVATWATPLEMSPVVQERPVIPPGTKMPDFRNMKGPRVNPHVPDSIENQTVRLIVHTTIGGRKLRIELANSFGKDIVSIGSAHIALRTTGSSIDPKTDHQLTFGGSATVEIPAGAVIVSDPVDLEIKPMSDLAVSLFLPKANAKPTGHPLGLHTSYIAAGDTTASASMSDATTTTAYVWLRSIDVVGSPSDFSIVCLGDSITDGFGTTTDANKAWPMLLAKRFADKKGGPRVSVLNQGISGNQVLRDGAGVSALARLDRDVLTEPGVRWIVLLEGINDINIHGQSTGPGALTADDLIRGYKQLIARAHMANVKIMGATLTPDEGVWLAGPIGEATRQKLNEWIRTSGAFDAVVDFDPVVADKEHPTRMRADLDPGDHIHPNDVGNGLMADAFNLATFTK
jgi:lysophospholipase L1-like esterase